MKMKIATMRHLFLAAFLHVAVLAAVALPISPARAADTIVNIDNFTFNPPRLTVKAGTVVTWNNHDDIPHTVASTTKLFRSKTLDTDDNFSFTFATPGMYEYFCTLHAHMKGTIVVEAATESTAPK
jgi:plastocyanin